MKLKFWNSLAAALLLAPNLVAGEFRWFGDREDILTGKPTDPTLVEERPGVRQIKSLRFENQAEGSEAKDRATFFLEVALEGFAPQVSELTVACFVFPERRKMNEDFLANKSDRATDGTGFRLFKVWDRWGLDVGNGSESKRLYATSKIIPKTWQHLAAVFAEGQVQFYHDGVPAGSVDAGSLEVSMPKGLVIGSGVRRYLPFSGAITGVSVSSTAANEDAINQLIRQATE